MKRILILGGSHRDIPLIKASQELGYFVITLGNGKNYLGHRYSDKYYNINFNEISKVKEIIKKEHIDHLIPGCGEESYLNTVQINQDFNLSNLDNLETAILVHNKWKFKEFCLDNGISTPKGFLYNKENKNDLDLLSFPVVVKPTNLSGGRGVDVVNCKKELELSLSKAYDVSDEIFLEEFIDGTLIAYSVFLQDQKIIYQFIGADKTYLNKYLITTAYPINIDEKIEIKLKNNIEKLSRLLQLVDGMFHLQVLIKNKIPYIIDVTRRIPGDLYPYLIEYNDEVLYSRAVVKSYTNSMIGNEFDSLTSSQNFVIRHCVMPTKNGIYDKLIISEELRDKIIDKLFLVESGYKIQNYLNTQIAIIFIKLDYYNLEIIEKINNLVYVKIKEL